MAALRENRSYGLSGKLSRGENVSVFHVKLTDSAARAIDRFRNGKVIFLCLFSFAFRQRAERRMLMLRVILRTDAVETSLTSPLASLETRIHVA